MSYDYRKGTMESITRIRKLIGKVRTLTEKAQLAQRSHQWGQLATISLELSRAAAELGKFEPSEIDDAARHHYW